MSIVEIRLYTNKGGYKRLVKPQKPDGKTIGSFMKGIIERGHEVFIPSTSSIEYELLYIVSEEPVVDEIMQVVNEVARNLGVQHSISNIAKKYKPHP